MTANWTELDTCNSDGTRPSCYLSSSELGELDAVAAIRMVVSCLSLMGASSIIATTIMRREFFNHKVHPIFVLSVADAMLALLYILGGIVWLRREANVSSRVWCFSAALPTVILQCVTVNLTVLYALLAYSGVRHTHIGNLLEGSDRESVWSPLRTTVSYLVAWFLPVAVVMIPFASVAKGTGLLHQVRECSCWCTPSLGNVIPYAHGRDLDTMDFRRNMRKLVIVFASVIGTHFLAGFIVLVVIYRLLIRSIHRMRVTVRYQVPTANYGAVAYPEAVLERAEFRAKRRVVYFLVVFIVSGLFNFLLCYELMFFDVGVLINGEKMSSTIEDAGHQNWKQKLYYITLCLQSVTITQQGFLNAIVYGWTREDFLDIMAVNRQRKTNNNEVPQLEPELNSSDLEGWEGEGETEKEGEEEGDIVRLIQHSVSREDHSLTHSMVDTEVSDNDEPS